MKPSSLVVSKKVAAREAREQKSNQVKAALKTDTTEWTFYSPVDYYV
jgi:hypothetical protein